MRLAHRHFEIVGANIHSDININIHNTIVQLLEQYS